MIETLDVLSSSTVPVVALATAKAHCRVDATDASEDPNLALYIAAVTASAESYLKRTLVSTQYRLKRDLLPVTIGGPSGNVAINTFLNSTVYPYTLGMAFSLLKPPLISVDQIQYLDVAGTLQTLDPSLYIYVTGTPGRIAPAYGKLWPFTLPQIGSVLIKYTAGYGTTTTAVSLSGGTTTTMVITAGPNGSSTSTTTAATQQGDVAGTTMVSNVPPNIQAAILLWVGSLFRNREAVTEGALVPLPYGVKELLDTASWGVYR